MQIDIGTEVWRTTIEEATSKVKANGGDIKAVYAARSLAVRNMVDQWKADQN